MPVIRPLLALSAETPHVDRVLADASRRRPPPDGPRQARLPLALGLLLGLLLLAIHPRAALAADVTIGLESLPPGAAIYLDSKEQGLRGYTAPGFTLGVSKGSHRIILELDGYEAVDQTIVVGKRQKFTFPLRRAQPRLDVRTSAGDDSARGAELFVDGVSQGTLPREVSVSEGRHLIEVRKAGFDIFSDTIELRPAERRPYVVTLKAEARLGTLMVTATSAGEVSVDGRPRGSAPVVIDKLPEGDHLVEVRRPEPDAPVFSRTVKVIANQQVTVQAELPAPQGKTGSLLVMVQVSDGVVPEILIDGVTKARAGAEIPDLRPGQHVVQVQARGYNPATKLVEVEAGRQRVERIEMQQTAEGRGVGHVRVIMLNPVDGAQYFVNGKRLDEAQILGDRGVEIAAGLVVVLVRKEGWGEVRKQAQVLAGATETVQVELRNVGRLVVDSTPPNAEVLLDRAPVGHTPYTSQEVVAGPHMIELRLPEMQPYVEQVVVRGGEQTNVTANLQVSPLPMAPTKISFSSYSAFTQAPGRFGVDIGAGFPWYIDLRLMVGAVHAGTFGLDVGAEVRSMGYLTEFSLLARGQLFRVGPLVIGANLQIGGGGGPRQRNSFNFEAGVPLTLLLGRRAHLTLRPYLSVASDRLCPSEDFLKELNSRSPADAQTLAGNFEHAGDRCVGGGDKNNASYGNAIGGVVLPSMYGMYSPAEARFQVEGTPVLDRFNTVRGMLQVVIEGEVAPNMTLWGMIEGAPGQPQRQGFTDKFNRNFPLEDLPLYGRVGLTVKF